MPLSITRQPPEPQTASPCIGASGLRRPRHRAWEHDPRLLRPPERSAPVSWRP